MDGAEAFSQVLGLLAYDFAERKVVIDAAGNDFIGFGYGVAVTHDEEFSRVFALKQKRVLHIVPLFLSISHCRDAIDRVHWIAPRINRRELADAINRVPTHFSPSCTPPARGAPGRVLLFLTVQRTGRRLCRSAGAGTCLPPRLPVSIS